MPTATGDWEGVSTNFYGKDPFVRSPNKVSLSG